MEKNCFVLLTSNIDEEKFAGLILASNLITHENQSQEFLEKVYEAIGVPFLLRLVNTEGEKNLYKMVGTQLLAFFCSLENLSKLNQFQDFIDPLLSMLKIEPLNQEFLCNILNSLTGLVLYQKSIDSTKIIKEIGQVLLKQYFNKDNTEKKEEDTIQEDRNEQIKFKQLESYFTQFFPLISKLLESPIDSYQNYKDILYLICKIFSVNNDMLKFNCLNLLLKFYLNNPDLNSNNNFFLSNIKKGLNDILSNNIDEEQRNSVFLLSKILLDKFSWKLFKIEDNNKKNTKNNNNKNSVNDNDENLNKKNYDTFFHLLLERSKIEIKIRLEDPTKIEKSENILIICFGILEHFIYFLTEDSFLDSKIISKNTIYSFNSTFKEIFLVILQYLNECNISNEKIYFENIVFESIKIICIFFQQETNLLKNEFNQVLPFILKLIWKNQEKLFSYFILILSNITTDDISRDIFLENNGFENILKFMKKSSNIKYFNNENDIFHKLSLLSLLTDSILNIFYFQQNQDLILNINNDTSILKLLENLTNNLILNLEFLIQDKMSNEILLNFFTIFLLIFEINQKYENIKFNKNQIEKLNNFLSFLSKEPIFNQDYFKIWFLFFESIQKLNNTKFNQIFKQDNNKSNLWYYQIEKILRENVLEKEEKIILNNIEQKLKQINVN